MHNEFHSFASDRPRIKLTILESNQCMLTANGDRCYVIEGNNISIHCNSYSNPSPASTVWYKGDSVRSNEDLLVTSARDVRDTGVYSCQSTTGPLAYNHPPLTSTHRLTVLVTCKRDPTYSLTSHNLGHQTKPVIDRKLKV